ncbi:unnamed protein product [Gadus morhua 'NCC']
MLDCAKEEYRASGRLAVTHHILSEDSGMMCVLQLSSNLPLSARPDLPASQRHRQQQQQQQQQTSHF